MEELILLKTGEIALKGANRGTFEDMLIKNAKRSLYGMGGNFKFYKAQSTIYAEPREICDLGEAVLRLSRVFGFSALSRARIVEKDYDAIRKAAVDYLHEDLLDVYTFRVSAKRADKSFSLDSPEICRRLGGDLLEAYQHLRVDLHNPELTIVVEVRDFAAYIHRSQKPGAGGIPVGCGGGAALLLSGGIDSPVAGWMMAKRGISILPIHFSSPPYTSERSLMKVKTLCQKLSGWCGRQSLHIVPFTDILNTVKDHCHDSLITLVARRQMMIIAEQIAIKSDCNALITGESLGQVASQTLDALTTTQEPVKLPILRPVIGMDKEEIVTIARKIDTFETSILPYEDCCTVFTPRHPKTKPRVEEILKAESGIDWEALRSKAIADTEVILC